MTQKLKPYLLALIIAGVVGGGYWYLRQNPAQPTALLQKFGLATAAKAESVQTVSGYIETDETELTAETKGRLARLVVDEGDYVEAGQILAQLDTALLEAEAAQAQAQVNTARAHLAKVAAGLPPTEIAKAEAAVAVAQAKAHQAEVEWQNAVMLRDNPQELEMQIDAARTNLTLAELRIQQTIPLKDGGEEVWDAWHNQWNWLQDSHNKCKTNPMTGAKMCMTFQADEAQKQNAGVAWNLAGADLWTAWADLNSAIAARDDAETQLADLLRLKDDPQEAQIKVAQTQAAYRTTLAEVEVTAAKLDALKAGPRPEQVAVAQAQVNKAEAGLAALQVKQNQHVITAPQAGWVVQRHMNAGEMAIPGRPLLTLANLNRVNLVVYVPEPQMGTVEVGQAIDVYVDALPGQPFFGYVTTISDQAEFTPKNVQTQEERVNTVFAVKISLDNEDQFLKPGMPADAVLSGEPEL